ncbi:MAG TPA: AraC family transcriptional regulator [Fimbriimonadaceae bacterium]|nr:AraC family transcriptional regulator [Fimbriimonadaceae bacterium]
MAKRLGLGQYCGYSVRRRQIHGFVITENRFAPGLQIDRHVHQHTHFTFILEGGFVESYDRIVLECDPGSTLFVPAGAPHTDRIRPDGAHTIGIELSPGVAERVVSQTGVLADARVLTDPRIEQAGRRLYREFRSADAAASLSMESIALEMLVSAARIRTIGEHGEPEWMRTVREILHEGFTESLSLSEIAAQVGVHETHLARAFRKRHGCTLGEYIRRLRVDSAARELKSGAKPVAEIAAEMGFYDQAHFCRTFKTAYGMSPSQYRSR